MKILVEGSSTEVGELLDDIERRERRFDERQLFFERMKERRIKRFRERSTLIHGGEIKLTDVLESFIKNGFFDQGKGIREVMLKLAKEGISAPSSTVHPLLSRLVTKQSLKREKNQIGVWEYRKR